MESIDDWQRAKYNAVFEQICALVQHRRVHDPGFTLETLVGLLETQYINQGNQPAIKGTVQELTDAATTAAFEYTLAQWQQEIAGSEPAAE